MKTDAKSEVLRYLGYRGQAISPELDTEIDRCMELCGQAAKPLHTWRTYDVAEEGDGVRLENSGLLLRGENIRAHLRYARKAALLALTLGAGMDALIYRWKRRDMTRAVVLDACAARLCEEAGQMAEDEIAEEAGRLGFQINWRYSPGYGDLPLDVQPGLLRALDAERRIGLTCTGSFHLLPRKSVTAVVGLLPMGMEPERKRGCGRCPMRDTCKMRRDGDSCGYQSGTA